MNWASEQPSAHCIRTIGNWPLSVRMPAGWKSKSMNHGLAIDASLREIAS